MDIPTCDVAVVGGGPAGLLAALLVGRTGADAVLVAPPPRRDPRTTALLDGSVAILRELGVWSGLEAVAAPLRKLRIVDGGRRLIRAPEVMFDSRELGLAAFGWNVPNAALVDALAAVLAASPTVRIVAREAVGARRSEDSATVLLDDGSELTTKLVIAADGRRSAMREAAGLTLRACPVDQTALAFTVSHDRDHQGVSTEIHGEEGPFTLVPLPGRRSSVVWVGKPARAEALLRLTPAELGAAATAKSGRLLGAMTVEGGVGSFPIVVGAAARVAGGRTLLVGEAAHVLPPIGAQGLNLGVRDAARAAKVVAEARAAGRDVGGDAALRAYALARSADVWTRTAATDLLNRSLMTRLLPAHAARGLGLAALAAIGPLRRMVMREGLVGGRAF
jgi:2-octaprenyl-6-methoxyphenol hydroxylase